MDENGLVLRVVLELRGGFQRLKLPIFLEAVSSALMAYSAPKMEPTNVPAMAALVEGGEVGKWNYDLKPEGVNDVTIKIMKCGVCATDHHMIDNAWGFSTYPLVPGHEIVGEVVSMGPKVTGFKLGDVVGLGCLAQSCEKCDFCCKERDNLCPQLVFTYFGSVKDETGEFQHRGGFASYIRTPYTKVLKIPEGLDPAEAAPLLCAGVTTFSHLMEFSKGTGDLKGKKVGVIGPGGLGHLAVQYAAKMGADTVVIARNDRKKDFATQLGATGFLISESKEEMEKAARSFDFIMSCISGGDFDVHPYLNLLSPYGTLHFVGIPDKPFTLDVKAMVFTRRAMSGSPVGSTQQCKETLEFSAKHGVKPIIERFPHSKAEEVLTKVKEGKVRFRAVLKNDLI